MTTSKALRQPRALFQLPPLPVAVALATIYLIWGSTYLGAAFALESYPPFMMTALRLLVSVCILAGALRMRGAGLPERREISNAVFTGAAMFTGAGMVALGQDLGVSSGLASVAVAAVVIWATLFARFFGQRPDMVEAIGVGTGIAGVVLLNLEKGMQANPAGASILVIGPMVWAFATVQSNRLRLPTGMMGVMFQMAGGLLALSLISALRGESFPSAPTASATIALAYLAVIGTMLGFSAYMYLVRNVRPAVATSYGYVNPLIAVLLGMGLRGEEITLVGLLAMAVIIAGVVLVMIGKWR